ncbi:MAG: cupredoxin family protein [Pseudomonadota bacterium]
MKQLITLGSILTIAASMSFAGGSHTHNKHKQEDHKTVDSAAEHGHTEGHDHVADHSEFMPAGMPGKASEVNRTIDVVMRENSGVGMIFEPTEIFVQQGDTIRFNVVNEGELEHEFVIDTLEGNKKHKEAMAKMEMEHDDPNSVRLDHGKSGEVIWKFANTGVFEFACLIPGHYESGMHGPITVASN